MKKFSNFREDNKRWVTKRRRTNTDRELSGFQSRLIQRPLRHFAHEELKSVIDCGTSGDKNEYEKDHHFGVHRVGSFYDCSDHACECSRLLLLQPASLSFRCGGHRCWNRSSYCNCSFLSLLLDLTITVLPLQHPSITALPLHHPPITFLPIRHPPITAPRHMATGHGFADIITSMGHGYPDTGEIDIRRFSQIPSPAPVTPSY